MVASEEGEVGRGEEPVAGGAVGEPVEDGDRVTGRGGGGDGHDDIRLEADDGGTGAEVGGG